MKKICLDNIALNQDIMKSRSIKFKHTRQNAKTHFARFAGQTGEY